MAKIRGTHSSPGVYTQFTDLSYAAKTMGITTLGLVGETIKGPAFEPIMISDQNMFQTYFGGTSAEKFKDSQYPKYQLPYIANSYLKASDQLYVCRVLGLSGYNAGPAWIITASKGDSEKYPIAVLRSRGKYTKYATDFDATKCETSTDYDKLEFDCASMENLEKYTSIQMTYDCESGLTSDESATSGFFINATNFGNFTIVCKDANDNEYRYPVTLNAGAKDYIYNVIGDNPASGEALVYVEELYDNYIAELISYGKIDRIDIKPISVKEVEMENVTDPVKSRLTVSAKSLTRNMVSQRYLFVKDDTMKMEDYFIGGNTNNPCKNGFVYEVQTNPSNETKYKYVYKEIEGTELKSEAQKENTVNVIKVIDEDLYYFNNGNEIKPLFTMSDYHEQFRCASTPWFVSEMKGDSYQMQVKKLFRLHTITDGNYSNTEIKVTIANVRPDEGRFDLYIRDFNDSDANQVILESYKNLTMAEGDPKFIGLQIGTLDGAYETKSKYVMAEVIVNEMTQNCVPAGFLGYPLHNYRNIYGLDGGESLINPGVTYNIIYDKNIKAKRQCFGISDIVGIDTDMLSYKGKTSYIENYGAGNFTNPFHMDSRMSNDVRKQLSGDTVSGVTITIDGDISTAGITWTTVSTQNDGQHIPVFDNETLMEQTIYADKNLRKFTACFYGGFDGWDIYRNARTNTDEFKFNKYKGKTFTKIQDGTYLNLDEGAITSDYYAYLAGIKQFEEPERYVINLFATPGIDYVNNTDLVDDVLDMLSENRKDTLYVVDTPDKPYGASDAVDEMYSSAEAVQNLEDTGIDTYYACTYYPWVKYFDRTNNIYINLPATKDVLRNMADVDNKKYPWYSPAGIERGVVECSKLHFFPKLEDEDTLYDGHINPIKSFSKDGIKVFGQKTMYSKDTPMNRVGVVRLMLYMRRLIIEATRSLIFEPNDETLKQQFENIIKPILSQIKTDRGISDYRIDVSQTEEQMDEHEMSATIWVKPIGALEYLEINFVVTPQSVSFDE